MNPDCLFMQKGPENDLTNEFEIGQQLENKEKVIMQLRCIASGKMWIEVFGTLHTLSLGWVVIGSYTFTKSRKKWKVRRYNGPHTCIQTSMGQCPERLESKVSAQHIFTMVKADLTISIKVLQGSVENHFGYKVSYRKV
ncbi:hypothetical protein Ahy_B05g078132 [Arachis hypogaea]|uniref:Uncharacterized protein n=1 Tax=Arachis hypogaea TaxID=3818 RepID=A0A444Z6D6_ARAHY|nr:hypothetical protein Ahy_B05g078132 [Arachis hypogaea]